MFCISYTQQELPKKDLKIIINFKNNEERSINVVEFQTCLKNASSISDIISRNIKQKDSMNIYNQDVILEDDTSFDKDLFISLATSIFNNEQIKYSEKNHQILLKISEIFQIQKLKKSIERFIAYFDQLNEFEFGRYSIIDTEFLCQLYLLDLTEDNIEDTLNASYRFIDELTSDSYGQILYRCIFSRLSKTELYLDFIVNKLQNFTKLFIKTLMRNYRFCSFSEEILDYDLPVICYLLRYFIENGYLKRGDEESFNYQNGWRSYTYQFFDFDDGCIHYDATYYVYRHYDELVKNNYALHRKLVLNGKNQDPIFQIIEKDDLESLKNLIAYDPSFDIDMLIESCYYESRPCFQTKSYSLIEIAAYFSSINIFKFLIVNNAVIRKKELEMMALYGGNPEIIRICQQNEINFDNKPGNEYDMNTPFMIVIKMHYFDLLRWLFEKEDSHYIPDDFDKLVGFSIRCSNFVAFYYLMKIYYYHDEDFYNNVLEFSYSFQKIFNSFILSYNIPVLDNIKIISNEDLQHTSDYIFDFNKKLLDILFTNYDTNLIDIILKNNKICDLKKIPNNNMSSLTFQKMGRFLITHKNVTVSSLFLADLIEDLLDDDLKNNEDDFKTENINSVAIYNQIKSPEFINQQIQLIYENALTIEDKILLLPVIFKYNLYENNYDDKYKEILKSNYDEPKFQLIKQHQKIFKGFIKYTNTQILEFVIKNLNAKTKKTLLNSSYDVADSLKYDNFEMFEYFITSEFSPFSKRMKFNSKSFFDFFYAITSIETLKKVVQIFIDNCKDCDFYNDIFLPEVLFHVCDSKNEIIEYLLNLPEIVPFINKENEKFLGLPPLLYACRYYISADCFKPLLNNEKVDINIRDSRNHFNIMSSTKNYDLLLLVLSNQRFKWTPEDAVLCIENGRYPGSTNIFELFLNGLLYENDEDHKNPLNLKIDFTDEQLSRIFNKLCITDERVEMAKRFYSKFSDRIDVNYKKDELPSFCLLDAIDCDCAKMVKFLLSISELDLNRKASTGSVNSHLSYTENITPFCFAVVCEKDEIIHLFFKRKADFNVNETFSDEIFYYFFKQNYLFTLCCYER